MPRLLNIMIVGNVLRSCAARSFASRWIATKRFARSSGRNRHSFTKKMTTSSSRIPRGGLEPNNTDDDHLYQYILALGSNLGDRYKNIVQALEALCESTGARTGRTSFLYETAPMYVTGQPKFLNGAIELFTSLEPHDVLARCKAVEQQLGRDFDTIRNGPRPIDVDLLLYQNQTGSYLTVDTPDLTIPHPRIQERDFVLVPLTDIVGKNGTLPGSNKTLAEMMEAIIDTNDEPTMVRVVPLPNGRFLRFDRTLIMGILNVTPDSFSDGGKWAADNAIQRALEMEHEGADIIDIGGESTRPGAIEVDIDEELRRTIPVIRGIRKGKHLNLLMNASHDI